MTHERCRLRIIEVQELISCRFVIFVGSHLFREALVDVRSESEA